METQPHILKNMNGPPQFNVGLKPIALENWLLPDDQVEWLKQKNLILDKSPDEVFQALANSLAAQTEAADLVAITVGKQLQQNEPPLLAASRLVSDDLIVMEKQGDIWQLTALSLCSPTFFDAKYAVGNSLALLHGPIPTGGFDLVGRIARIFDSFAPDNVLERFNWTVQWGADKYTPNGQKLRDEAASASIAEAPKMLFERVERQTIRRLPKTGAVLFTIRVRLNNLFDILQDPAARAAFENAWNAAPENVRQYKKWQPLERHVAAIL